jgi:hypothetical protein
VQRASDEAGVKTQIEGIKQEANNHQKKIGQLVEILSKSEALDSQSVQESARETQQKASQMMHIYLGEDPDSSEALDFLGLAEGGEVIHYEALKEMTKDIKLASYRYSTVNLRRRKEAPYELYSASKTECC